MIKVTRKISTIAKDKSSIRLVDKEGKINEEFSSSHLDLSKYQQGDFVLASIEKGKLLSLEFPPGAEPSEPTKEQIKQQLIDEVASKKEVPYHIVYIGEGKVIISKGIEGDEQSFPLKDKALQYSKNFKAGEYIGVKLDETCQNVLNFWKLNADGSRKSYDNGYNQKPAKVVTIGGTINLQNNENLKVEVSGPYENLNDVKKLKEELTEIIQLFGKDEITKGLLQNYSRRVLGGSS